MTHTAQVIARVLSGVPQPMVASQAVRATVAVDRTLILVQRYALISVPH